MISGQSDFKFVDRGFKKALVLLPGWASDWRIFNTLDLGYNYIFSLNFSPEEFAKRLLGFLEQRKCDKISLFGWSLGGFQAAEFAGQYPQKVDELNLLAVRRKYEPALLRDIADKLRKNKRAFLSRLYPECFSSDDRAAFEWFRDNLLRDYSENLALDDLIKGLEYLSAAQITPEPLHKIKRIRIFHGSDDKVAPVEEARSIAAKLPQAEFVCFQGCGHMPFLNSRFKMEFINGQPKNSK
jgi:pimeloyl-ACP methyl ester carboxylesterase